MISLPLPKLMTSVLTFVLTYQDNGPYFDATKGCYQAASLQQLIFHVRQAMEDNEDIIAIYKDGQCKGMWLKSVEGHIDSAGDALIDHEGYELLRPSTKEQWMWNRSLVAVQ